MNTTELSPTLTTLFSELVLGASTDGAFVLNRGDAGLLASLDKLNADDASVNVHGGATIAAHVAHLRYSLSLMNRWAAGETNPFADADWSAAWRTQGVGDADWFELRRGLGDEAERWLLALGTPREAMPIELNGMVGSIVHLAYHLGAMRQIDARVRGPREGA
jgi:hypothetical protein